MSSAKKDSLSIKNLFIVLTVVVLITDLTILLDLPFLRQIFGFLFLAILPGLLILQLLKLSKLEYTEKIVLSVGLSISFLMLFGLLINSLSLNIGYKTPLAIIPLLVSFNIAFIVLAIIAYKANKETIFSLPNFELSTSEKAFLIVPILFPALSIFGMHIMNTTDNNIILMFLYLLIIAYVIFVCFFNQKFPKRLYPVVIFLISISLLLIYMLRFPHIYGSDVHTEYYLYMMTLNNSHWSIVLHGTLDACLSISLLPAIFQSIMNVNAQEYLFKGVYVSICSFGPLAIYILSKKYVGDLYAFLASFFFISQSVFLSTASSPRTNLAIFFAALAVMVFFNDKIDPLKRRILFIVFMLSVVVSHYSSAYLFFFVLLFTWVVVELFSRRYVFKRTITLTIVLLFFAFIFFWYSQVTEAAFNSGVGYIERTFLNLNRLFIEELRDPGFEQMVGKGLKYGLLSRINFFVVWGSLILIGIGILTMIKRYKEMIVISTVRFEKPDFLKSKFEIEYFTMVLACAVILILMVALPYVSTGYGIDRLYSLVLIILSICFIIGGMTLSKNLSFIKQTFKKSLTKNASHKPFLGKKSFTKRSRYMKNSGKKNGSNVRAYLTILLILIPYFLMVTGTTHQIAGIQDSIILNSVGKEYDIRYPHDQESCAAKRLKGYAEKSGRLHTTLYTTDDPTGEKLISQSELTRPSINCYSFSRHSKIRGYLYLSYNNVVNDKFQGGNMSDYTDMFVGKKKIYDNGGSEVWK